jgi:DNA-binding CsgD family transcriptional regulator
MAELGSERARRELDRIAAAPGDPDAFFGALFALLGRLGLPAVGACWHLTDPETGLFTWTGYAGELPGDFAAALHNELMEDDVAKYADLAIQRDHVATLVHATGGRPRRSARFREQLSPGGFGDELRLAFVDRFGRWGSMGLFREEPFDDGERTAAAALVPHVAAALRRGIARATAAGDDAAPGVLVLDADDRVRSRDAHAVELLDGCARTGELPGALHILAAQARAAAARTRGRTLNADGAWLTVDASPLEDDEGAIALVVRPAPAPSLLDVRLRAAGLTDRERQIAVAVLRGDDTATIAAALHLSPWTVQDHLKAIFDKTAVRSRRAFVAHWALSVAGVA